MIKSLLLKLADKINSHYKTTEIKNGSFIKFKNGYYIITEFSINQRIGYVTELEIKALETINCLELKCN